MTADWWQNMARTPKSIRAILCDDLGHMTLPRGPCVRLDLRCAAQACKPITGHVHLRDIGAEFPINLARERIHYLRQDLWRARLSPHAEPYLHLPWLRLADRQPPQSLRLRRHLVACRIVPDRTGPERERDLTYSHDARSADAPGTSGGQRCCHGHSFSLRHEC